jgi:hypothetical protein
MSGLAKDQDGRVAQWIPTVVLIAVFAAMVGN